MTETPTPKDDKVKREPKLEIPGQRPSRLIKADATLSEKQKAHKERAFKAAYSHAQSTIREKHLAEFNEIRVDVMARLGYEWAPEPTAKEKAQAEFLRLLAENEDFAALVQQKQEAEDAVAVAAENQTAVEDPTYPTPES